MNRVRVLRLIARMNVGGPALQVVGLTEGLDPHVFETRLLVGSVGPGEASYIDLRAQSLRAHPVPGLGRSVSAMGDLRALQALVSEVRRFRPHILHTHTAKAGVLGRVAARLCGVPFTVHTFHGHLLHGYFPPNVTAAIRLTERCLAQKTSALVAVGTRVRDELLAAGIGRAEQFVVVPPGVELPVPPSRVEARTRLGIADRVPVIAFVARLTAIKRPDRALDALTRLLPEHPQVRLLVAGEGPLLEEMRRRARPLGEAVVFLGWRPDVEAVYSAADVVVLTSDNEGMPVALIEAALCGVPAVTARVGSANEVVVDGETGLVVEPDADAVALGVHRLLSDAQLRQRMGDAAIRHARASFTVQRLVGDTESLYLSLIDERGGSPSILGYTP